MRPPAIRPRRGAPLLAAVLLAWPAHALASVSEPIAAPTGDEQPVLLRAKKVVTRPGEVLENAQVLVQAGRILRVGTDLEAPEGARVIEGEVVCAAFIDPWATIGLRAEDARNDRTDAATRSVDGWDAWSAERERRESLGAGVTLARVQVGDASSVGGIGAIMRLDPVLDRHGAVVLEDANLATSVGLSQRGRPVDVLDRIGAVDKLVGDIAAGAKYREDEIEYRYELEAWQKEIAEKEEELEKDFKKAKKARDKDKKEADEKGKEFKEKKYKEDKKPKEPRHDADKAVFARVAMGELTLVVQVHRASEIRALLDGTREMSRLRMVLAGGVAALEFADELAARRIPVIVWPTPQRDSLPDEFDGHDLALAAQLEEAGVPVLIGSGGAGDSSRDLPILAGLAIGHGLDPDEALAAITLRAARAFDLADRVGSVEAGKEAELLVLDGEPLKSSTRVQYVISGGRVAVSPQ